MKTIILILAALLCSVSDFSQTSPPENDIQIRNETSVSIPLINSKDEKGKEFERLSFSINSTFRFGNNISRLIDERIGLGINYRINNYISLAPDIVYRVQQPSKGRKNYESRFRFAISFDKKWKNISIDNRNQIEYRLRNSRQDSLRYRNRFRFNYSIVKDKKEIFAPFVSNEPQYEFQARRFIQNQFFAGISKKFNKNFSTEIFYLFVKDVSSPKTVNGIGINLKFKIN